MSKIIDITNKLNFDEKPLATVKGVKLEVNNDAMDMLEVSAIFEDIPEGGNLRSSDILKLFGLLFDEENRNKVKAMKLSITDFASLIMNVAQIAVNNFEEVQEGEVQTPATI